MAQKQLHELLQDDQEPFQLKNYIADRRCQLKKTQYPENKLGTSQEAKTHISKTFLQKCLPFLFPKLSRPEKIPTLPVLSSQKPLQKP